MKSFKVLLHPKDFSSSSLLVSSKDFPSLSIGDIVEIGPVEDDISCFLLQVDFFQQESQKSGSISIDQSIASIFQLKTYMEVTIKVIDNLKDVSLDSVELTFKDQYIARSDMWRLKKDLINTCLYPDKKLVCFGIRCQVFEMYIQGEKVASGIVTDDTKIVYRSASSMVYLFIQMSCEMWDFDINRDLYFEKAIDGFLPDLFSKWKTKKLHCNHDVSIVLFSRTFYDAQFPEEFPPQMRECLQQDYKGRFFEDFYRVAVQNERYDDWNSTIILLKKLFNEYQDTVLKYHERLYGPDVPKAINSTASQGNFLEVLNMSLNVFEKHYMDRSFDRTGQLSVVITPGVGFFEVDRELTIITKQRIIDNGIGSDLVCLGEQPLHAVPLFKFYNKQLPRSLPSVADDYNMPHWINLSFYSTPNQNIYTNFVPQIKLPTLLPDSEEDEKEASISKRSRHASQPDPSFPELFDYDEYDRQVFKMPTQTHIMRETHTFRRPRRRKETEPSDPLTTFEVEEINRLMSSEPLTHASSTAIAIPRSRKISRPIVSPYQSLTDGHHIPHRLILRDDLESSGSPPLRHIVGSDPSAESQNNKQCLTQRLKALVNPFNPSQITIRLTSNRRRWTHVFPLGPTEYRVSTLSRRDTISSSNNMSFNLMEGKIGSFGNRLPSSFPQGDYSLICGTTNEQVWTPAATTGVDWKSLVIPACLPITTDYFPDRMSLKHDYVLSVVDLTPEDIMLENIVPRYFQNDEDSIRHQLTTPEVYKEFILQRLQQGFQLIVLPKQHSSFSIPPVSSSPQFSPLFKGSQKIEQLEECLLSIGRIFHKLHLDDSKITVTQYRPRHPHREVKVHYCYRFHAPDSDSYGVSWVDFTSERLENYNWNYLDHYICNRGEGEFELVDNLKYWRLRMLLLPSVLPETRKILESSEQCDLYTEFSEKEKVQQCEGVLKFLEVLNKVRRSSLKKSKLKGISASQLESLLPPRRSSVGHSSLIPRTSSNSFKPGSDRPRMRSNSARMGACPEPLAVVSGRISPATEVDGRVTVPKIDNPLASSLSLDSHDENVPVNVKKLNENSSHAEIIELMKHSIDGLHFITKMSWSMYTFISSDAVSWLMERMEGIIVEQQAIKLLQTLVDKGLIRHTSRVKSHAFIYGFYLYYIVSSNDEGADDMMDSDALYFFEREWMEVELSPPRSPYSATSETYCFPSDEDIWTSPYLSNSKLKFKSCNVQIEQVNREGRQEWGQLRYHNIFRPCEAFQMVVQWMVATGNKVADLVQCWARKSNQYGLQLVPIPSDPFALPFSNDSDPLRGPIFIPLDLSCLMDTSAQTFDEEGLLKLQEKILCRFGFIPYRSPTVSCPPQYVHVTGSMFVMLPVRQKAKKPTDPPVIVSKAMHLNRINSPHNEYITRHFSGNKTKRVSAMNIETDTKIGFLWSWNYMITKRWKNAGTVDENFMRKVMRDFRAFCSNQNSRLEEFWKHSEMSEFHGQSFDMNIMES